jgi:UDPglucose--hexose-1-phosphate uridylyltransferase
MKVFKNHGAAAGASMTHSHSQIMGIPVIPPSVTARLNCMKEIFDLTGKCSICDLQSDQNLMINGSTHFFAVAPFAASYAFEIWIVPREHSTYFHELDRAKVNILFFWVILCFLGFN